MVYFQTENHNLGKFWRVFVDIQSIFLPFGIFYGHLIYVFCGHLVYFPRCGLFYQEKSGSPVAHRDFSLRCNGTRQFFVYINVTKMCTEKDLYEIISNL
jgi:hypothetical protein